MSDDQLAFAATAIANMRRIERAYHAAREVATLVETLVKIKAASTYMINFASGNTTLGSKFSDCGDIVKTAAITALVAQIETLHGEIDRLGCNSDVKEEMPDDNKDETPF